MSVKGSAVSAEGSVVSAEMRSVPGSEDFTPQAIYRAVLLDTVQHPLTILPAALVAVGGLWMSLFGYDPTSFGLTFLSAMTSASAFVWNYFIRGERLAARHIARLREKRRTGRFEEADAVVAGWEQTGHADGAQQGRELRAAYQRLDAYLKDRVAEKSDATLNLERLRVMADDTYFEGIAILRRGLEVQRALMAVDRHKFETELDAWRAELESLALRDGLDALQEAQKKSLETRIGAHERRLALHTGQARSLAELMAQSEELEAALESTYLTAVDLGRTDELFVSGGAAAELERAANAARRVEERLRAAGTEDGEQDEIYLEAARQRSTTR